MLAFQQPSRGLEQSGTYRDNELVAPEPTAANPSAVCVQASNVAPVNDALHTSDMQRTDLEDALDGAASCKASSLSSSSLCTSSVSVPRRRLSLQGGVQIHRYRPVSLGVSIGNRSRIEPEINEFASYP